MDLVESFIFGSAFGIINEIIISKFGHRCIKNFDNKCLLSMTLFNIYGFTFLIIALLLKYTTIQKNILIFVIVLLLILFFVECIGGKISLIWNGKQTWKYSETYIPMCDGYFSVVSSLYFIGIFLFYFYIIKS